jgi:hypothetical protein
MGNDRESGDLATVAAMVERFPFVVVAPDASDLTLLHKAVEYEVSPPPFSFYQQRASGGSGRQMGWAGAITVSLQDVALLSIILEAKLP